MGGQKVNPIGLRLGINRTWESTWYSDKNYAELLHEDLKLRKYIKNRLYAASVSRIQIERAANRIRVTIHTARPGMVIGRGRFGSRCASQGPGGHDGQAGFGEHYGDQASELDAQLVAENIAAQLERRISFRTCDEAGHGQSRAAWGGSGNAGEIQRSPWRRRDSQDGRLQLWQASPPSHVESRH